MNSQIHLTLTSLPLLQGVSATDIARMLEKTRIQKLQATDGMRIVRQGDICQQLTYLVEGTLLSHARSADGRYSFEECLTAPSVIEPEILYGIRRHYTSDYTAQGSCQLMLLPKADVNRMLATIEVFRLNYLNTLATLAVRRSKPELATAHPDLKSRIAQFLLSHTLQPTGWKRFDIRMSDLGTYLGVSRGSVSAALHALEADGTIVSDRGQIEIPDAAKLKLHV